jgi:hypothetical protein
MQLIIECCLPFLMVENAHQIIGRAFVSPLHFRLTINIHPPVVNVKTTPNVIIINYKLFRSCQILYYRFDADLVSS